MLSRAMDDTLKFWDWRYPSEPIQTWDDLLNIASHTNVGLSPDEKIIFTGDSVKRGMGNGCLHFFKTDTFEKLCQIGISEGNVVRSLWHPKINQIVTTSTDTTARIFFDLEMSKKGAINCIMKEPRKHQPDDMQYGNPILAPHALPQFKQTYMSATKRKEKEEEEKKEKEAREKYASDPNKIVSGKSLATGYVLGSSNTYQQYIMKMINKNVQRDMDPREALLQYQEAAENDPFWVTPAYQKTQPKTIYNYESLKNEKEGESKICPKCGLKYCVCKNNPLAEQDED